jgi:hypothetical protein
MAKLHIVTQYQENYGAHDWDGQGDCPQYWKFKGGDDYFVLNVDLNRAAETVDAVRSQIEWDTQYSRSWVINWEVVADDFVTEFERNQLEWEGKISWPVKCLKVNELVAQ